MAHINIDSNMIGVPAFQIPVDEDLLKNFQASGGQLMLPILFCQLFRRLDRVEKACERLETELGIRAANGKLVVERKADN